MTERLLLVARMDFFFYKANYYATNISSDRKPVFFLGNESSNEIL